MPQHDEPEDSRGAQATGVGKPAYGPPKVIPLDQLTQGQGVCEGTGNSDADYCTSGTNGFNATTCNPGGSAAQVCSVGNGV